MSRRGQFRASLDNALHAVLCGAVHNVRLLLRATTRAERIEPATPIARHSRVNSSTIDRHLSLWSFAQALKSKS